MNVKTFHSAYGLSTESDLLREKTEVVIQGEQTGTTENSPSFEEFNVLVPSLYVCNVGLHSPPIFPM